jgi:hypothetical protein
MFVYKHHTKILLQKHEYKYKEKLLSTEMDFWRRTARTSTLVRVRNEAISHKNVGNTNNFGQNGRRHFETIRTCSTHGG